MSSETTVSILPKFTPEQGEKANQSIKQRDEADYQCFMVLDRLMKVAGSEITALLTKWGYFDVIEDIDTALKERKAANDTLMQTIVEAGRNEHATKSSQG